MLLNAFKPMNLKTLSLLAAAFCLTGLAAPAWSAPAAEPEVAQGHILAPNEVVEIKVFQEPELDTTVRIPADGRITFPLLGEVAIGGKSVQQATRLIRDRLEARFLVNPQVRIAVIEEAKRLFTVIGQVQRPGTYRFPERQNLDLVQVIGIAGGYTRLANPGKITVKRRVDGKETVFRVDGKRLAREENAEPFPIEAGDIITVAERFF
jgi:protein involved in polysaccharide export with SLBB domain